MDIVSLNPDIKAIIKHTKFKVDEYDLISHKELNSDSVLEYLGHDSIRNLTFSKSEFDCHLKKLELCKTDLPDRLVHSLLFLINFIRANEISDLQLEKRRHDRGLETTSDHNYELFVTLNDFDRIGKEETKMIDNLKIKIEKIDNIIKGDLTLFQIAVRKLNGTKYKTELDYQDENTSKEVLLLLKEKMLLKLNTLILHRVSSSKESLLYKLSSNLYELISNSSSLSLIESRFFVGYVLVECGMLPTKSEYRNRNEKSKTTYYQSIYKTIRSILESKK